MYLSDPVFLDVEYFIEIDRVVNPLWLNVFFCFLLLEIFSVSDHVSDISIDSSQ